mgnify:FL=1
MPKLDSLNSPAGRFQMKWPPFNGLGLIVATLVLGGCQALGPTGSNSAFSNFNLFGSPSQKFVVGEDVVLPREPKVLDRDGGVQATLALVVELDQQKRFAEARHLLSQVRAAQPPAGPGYQASTSSMAVLALKEGNFVAFKALARQLDLALGSPVRVESQHLEVITVYRAVTGKALPVNASANMKMLKDKYSNVQSAQNGRN